MDRLAENECAQAGVLGRFTCSKSVTSRRDCVGTWSGGCNWPPIKPHRRHGDKRLSVSGKPLQPIECRNGERGKVGEVCNLAWASAARRRGEPSEFPEGLRSAPSCRLRPSHREVANVAYFGALVRSEPACRSHSAHSRAQYVMIRSAPARLKAVIISSTHAFSSSQPLAAAALSIAYSPLTL